MRIPAAGSLLLRNFVLKSKTRKGHRTQLKLILQAFGKPCIKVSQAILRRQTMVTRITRSVSRKEQPVKRKALLTRQCQS